MKKTGLKSVSFLLAVALVLLFVSCEEGGGTSDSLTISIDAGGDIIFVDPGLAGSYGVVVGSPMFPVGFTTVYHSGSDGPDVVIAFKGTAAGTYNLADGEVTLTYVESPTVKYMASVAIQGIIPAVDGSVVVTEMGAVGGRIIGTFTITAADWGAVDPTGTTSVVSGSFDVTREVDT